MKKITKSLFLILSVIVLTSAVPVSKADDSNLAKAETESISTKRTLDEFVKMSVKDFSAIKGSKVTFKEKMVFKIAQRELKKEIKAGRVSKDKVLDVKAFVADEMPKFNIGGFVLGLLLGLIGVGLAHIFSNDKSFRRSSWYGFGALLILVVILTFI